MRMSQFFLPTIKETPAEAAIPSHRLMLRAGMIRQSSAGIYSWLPLGLRVMKKIEQIVREEQNRFGANEILMPTMQPADLWRESGRYDAYGAEMLRIKDRGDRDLLFGPTAEEVVTDIVRRDVKSYKDLPLMLYNIQWKFRDEIRPRFGIMRGREFLMKDNYSFDIDFEGARKSYDKMFVAYLNTFARMGLKAIPVQADTGPIGGDLSHEFCILAETGESEIFADKAYFELDMLERNLGPEDDLGSFVEEVTQYYAKADELHVAEDCPLSKDELVVKRGVEVGHIFYFGTKYSEPLGATVTNEKGEKIALEMGSYGIGVSRLVGGIIEASHDENGIIWPEEVAPFKVAIINLKQGDDMCDNTCQSLYQGLLDAGIEVLYDDRKQRAGGKFADMDLIGIPYQVIIGPRGLKEGQAEIKTRATGERENIAVEAVLPRFAS